MAVSSVETEIHSMPSGVDESVEQKTLIRPEALERARKDYSAGKLVTGSELTPEEMEELAKFMRDPVQRVGDWVVEHILHPTKKTAA